MMHLFLVVTSPIPFNSKSTSVAAQSDLCIFDHSQLYTILQMIHWSDCVCILDILHKLIDVILNMDLANFYPVASE